MVQTPEPDIDGPIEAAKFVDRCSVNNVRSENGEIILRLEREYRETQLYTLYVQMSRVSRSGTQVVLVDDQTGDRIYEAP